jgi:hypothetical protein
LFFICSLFGVSIATSRPRTLDRSIKTMKKKKEEEEDEEEGKAGL